MAVSEKKQQLILKHLSDGMPKTQAAKMAGIVHSTMWRECKRNPLFASQVEEACIIGSQKNLTALESEAYRRGVLGVQKPIFYEGKQIDTIHEYSDRLLIILLKSQARRAKDNSYIERTDVTSDDAAVNGGLLVIHAADKDEDAWHDRHSGGSVAEH